MKYLILLLALSACASVPERQLTPQEQKQANDENDCAGRANTFYKSKNVRLQYYYQCMEAKGYTFNFGG